MIKLNENTNEFIKIGFPYYTIREDKVIIKGGLNATIPSKIYPLINTRTINMFCYANTEEIEDSKLKDIFDSIELPIGRCYTNTNRVVGKLKEEGYTDLKTYVGWVIIQGTPIHHCWAVYKDIYLLDGGIHKTDYEILIYLRENNVINIEEQRKVVVEFMKKNENKKNSEVKTFGRVVLPYMYIGTEMDPLQGGELFNEIMRKNPNHPSYAKGGMNAKGLSKTQQMIYDKNK